VSALSVLEAEAVVHNRDRKPELQSVRGIAALIVLIHHCTFYYTDSERVRAFSELLLNAHAAVVLFYVLSGYVLSLSLKDNFNREHTLRFYVRRVFESILHSGLHWPLHCYTRLFFTGSRLLRLFRVGGLGSIGCFSLHRSLPLTFSRALAVMFRSRCGRLRSSCLVL